MIKKIDANEYGVVKYAITSVEELNRLPKKIAPSSQAILIENGLRVFVYGDGQWVEEVVDGDLSENMQSIVADYERSKIGYDGVKRGSLEERLKDDFQGIYDILNARDYCEYSGKELKTDNTWMGNQIDTRVEGRTLQNLFDYNKVDVNNSQAIKIVDGRIKSTYISWDYRINVTNHLLKKDGVYTVIIDLDMGDYSGDLELRANVSTKLKPYKQLVMPTSGIYVCKYYTTAETLEAVSLLWVKGDDPATVTGTFNFGLMILEGDHTQTPLSELPYLEGIESVGEREIGKNLLDPSELEYGSITEGKEDISEEYTTNRKRSGFIKVKPNTDYVFSSNKSEFNTHWRFYDIDKKYLLEGYGGYSQTITTPSNCEYIRIHNGHTDGTPLGNFKLQVEEGTVATEYEPFGYKIKGKSCGKNLFDIRKWHGALYKSGTSLEITEEGKVIVYAIDSDSYTRTGATGSSICFENERKHLYLVHENTTYTLSMKCEGENYAVNYVQFYDENYNSLRSLIKHGTDTGFKITFKTPMKTKFLGIRVGIKDAPVGSSLCYSDFQLEENDHTTPYEPYQESTYSIHSPIPLRSLPSGVCDVYDFESGAVIQRVGKVVLDGSEDWTLWIENTTVVCFHTSIKNKKSHHNILCDKFGLAKSYKDDIEGITTSGNVTTFGVSINKNKLASLDVDGFKQWLSQNPTTVYYELIEPIIHYLTPSQLKSFDGTTHVISENTLIPTTITKILTDTYANVSNVNSTAYSLRRGVNDVAETSAIINETDVEQDDVLDVTMCAIDELYSMLEPNLE